MFVLPSLRRQLHSESQIIFIDRLTDVAGITALGALDDFSDMLHDEIMSRAGSI